MTPPSKLLENLEQQLRTCTDRAERSRLVCRKAIHLVRLDHRDEASTELAALRESLSNTLDPVSATWIMLAEGVALYFAQKMDLSLDRLKRAQGIARSAGLKSDEAAVSGWLAQIFFLVGDLSEAIAALKNCLEMAPINDHFSRGRASLIAADMYCFAGDLPRQRIWERAARAVATADGDEASIAALLLNSATNRVHTAAIEHALGHNVSEQLEHLSMELRSSLAFDSSFSQIGLQHQPKSHWGQICMIEGRFKEAVECLQPSTGSETYISDRTTACASLALAYLQLGDRREAEPFAEKAAELILDSTQTDDTLALSAARLSAYRRQLGDSEESDRLMTLAQSAYERFQLGRQQLRTMLDALPPPDLK